MKISKLHLIGEMSLQIIICILILTVMLSIQVFMYRSSALNLLSFFSLLFLVSLGAELGFEVERGKYNFLKRGKYNFSWTYFLKS